MGSTPVPQYQPPSEDPQTTALKAKAEQDQIAATRETTRIDSASLLARYGTLVSVANAQAPGAPGNVPVATPSAAPGSSGLAALLPSIISSRPLIPPRVA